MSGCLRIGERRHPAQYGLLSTYHTQWVRSRNDAGQGRTSGASGGDEAASEV